MVVSNTICSIVCMYQITFIHSSLGRHLGFFSFMDIIMTTIINMHTHKLDSWTIAACIFLNYFKTNHIIGKGNGMVFY